MIISKTNKNIVFINAPFIKQFPNVYNKLKELRISSSCKNTTMPHMCTNEKCTFVINVRDTISNFENFDSLSDNILGFITATDNKLAENNVVSIFNLCAANVDITKSLLNVTIQENSSKIFWIGLPLSSRHWDEYLKLFATLGFAYPVITSKDPYETELNYQYMSFRLDKPPFISMKPSQNDIKNVITKADNLRDEATIMIVEQSKPLQVKKKSPVKITTMPIVHKVKIPSDCDPLSYITQGDKIGLKFRGQDAGMTVNKLCLKGYQLCKALSSGAYGSVYKVCDINANCNYIIKFQSFEYNPKEQKESWELEVNITMLADKHHIGAKYFGHWLCDNDRVGVIVAELWDGSLENQKSSIGTFCISQKLVNKLEKEISELHKLGYVHADIMPKNILVKKDNKGNIIDVTLTDFGLTNTIEYWKHNLFSSAYEYHFEPYIINDKGIAEKNSYYIMTQYFKNYYKKEHGRDLSFDTVKKNPTLMDQDVIYYLKHHCHH
jgi:hypothetical protein